MMKFSTPSPSTMSKGRLKNYLAFCRQNVWSLWDFCGQLRPSYFCTIPIHFQLRRFRAVGLAVFALSLLVFPGPLSAENRMKGPDSQPIRRQVTPVPPVSTLKWIGSGAIRLYSKIISPADGPRSPSYPTSTAYGQEAINSHGFLMGILLTADRLLHEADIHRGPKIIHHGISRYYDPVKYNTYWWQPNKASN
jgi:uncharacterized protein